jgi:ferredoxin
MALSSVLDSPELRPLFRSRGPLLLAALLLGALPSSAGALQFIPADPDHCDAIQVSVSRSFSSDCGWSASAGRRIDGNRIEILLTVGRLSEHCLPFAREQDFQAVLGTLSPGEYEVRVTWVDSPELSETAPLTVSEETCRGFVRGDVNGDLASDISDGIGILSHLFLGKSLDCREPADADGSGAEEVTDAIFLFNFLFNGGLAPPAPYPACGTLPEGSPTLGCENPYCDTGHAIVEELVWMSRPDGCVQCSSCNVPSLDDVAQGLENSGIDVKSSSWLFLAACLACDVCPSGRHYLVLVTLSDALALVPAGWTRWAGQDEGAP